MTEESCAIQQEQILQDKTILIRNMLDAFINALPVIRILLSDLEFYMLISAFKDARNSLYNNTLINGSILVDSFNEIVKISNIMLYTIPVISQNEMYPLLNKLLCEILLSIDSFVDMLNYQDNKLVIYKVLYNINLFLSKIDYGHFNFISYNRVCLIVADLLEDSHALLNSSRLLFKSLTKRAEWYSKPYNYWRNKKYLNNSQREFSMFSRKPPIHEQLGGAEAESVTVPTLSAPTVAAPTVAAPTVAAPSVAPTVAAPSAVSQPNNGYLNCQEDCYEHCKCKSCGSYSEVCGKETNQLNAKFCNKAYKKCLKTEEKCGNKKLSCLKKQTKCVNSCKTIFPSSAYSDRMRNEDQIKAKLSDDGSKILSQATDTGVKLGTKYLEKKLENMNGGGKKDKQDKKTTTCIVPQGYALSPVMPKETVQSMIKQNGGSIRTNYNVHIDASCPTCI